MITITTHGSAPDTLIPDLGVVILGASGFDDFDTEWYPEISTSTDLVALGTDDAYGAGSSTLTVSLDGTPIPQANLEVTLRELSAGSGDGLGPIVSSTIHTTGPGNGFAPITRTYQDGTIKAFAYLPDGLTIDTMTVTLPSGGITIFTAVYNVNGVRTHWAL